MRLKTLRLSQFRNLAEVGLSADAPSWFFVGRNGQGKTNLLEAIGLLGALRSFRSADWRVMRRWGCDGPAQVLLEVEHPRLGETTVRIELHAARRTVCVDGEPITRLADFLGLFPVVAMTADEVQIIRGGPQLRRGLLNSFLSTLEPGYLDVLRRFHGALSERNRLLKARAQPALFRAFEAPMAEAAEALQRRRAEAVPRWNTYFQACYGALVTDADESPQLHYRPDVPDLDAEGYLRALEAERQGGEPGPSTRRGPHRDELGITLKDHPARTTASEGQQRSLMLALRLAQTQWLKQARGVAPLLLADDLLGELDAGRREAFWRSLDPQLQVIATGTEPPPPSPRPWQLWAVEAGQCNPIPAPLV